jgi:hypothetical protein
VLRARCWAGCEGGKIAAAFRYDRWMQDGKYALLLPDPHAYLNIKPRDAAKSYHDGGLCVVPLVTDGSKKPHICWGQYQEVQCAWNEIAHWWRDDARRGLPAGIGVVCGVSSGNREVLDVETAELVASLEQVMGELLNRLPKVMTPDGGAHFYYRCEVIAGNTVLARDPDEHVLIETRGRGGMAVAPGSPAKTHLSNGAWLLFGLAGNSPPRLVLRPAGIPLSIRTTWKNSLRPRI